MASCRAVFLRLLERLDHMGARRLAVLFPTSMAWVVLSSAHVPPYVLPLLAVFAAWLPMLVIAWLATVVVSLDGERRARRSMRPRPRVAYLLLATGWVAAGVVSGLAAWAAGARSTGPGAGEDWIATGLVWSTIICICATVMMAGCALTARATQRSRRYPGWRDGAAQRR